MLERARRGELDWWAGTPRGRLALIIVLDQFSRSVYRGAPLAYAQDPVTQRLAVNGIDTGMGHGLADAERTFFTLLLQHSEELILQERGVRYHEEMVANTPLLVGVRVLARASQRTPRCDSRFGHHPHRNTILGRTSTPEELEYLKDKTPVHVRKLPEVPSEA